MILTKVERFNAGYFLPWNVVILHVLSDLMCNFQGNKISFECILQFFPYYFQWLGGMNWHDAKAHPSSWSLLLQLWRFTVKRSSLSTYQILLANKVYSRECYIMWIVCVCSPFCTFFKMICRYLDISYFCQHKISLVYLWLWFFYFSCSNNHII